VDVAWSGIGFEHTGRDGNNLTAAISLFGFNSGAALANVVGVLIEVPVMLLVVQMVNTSKGWYEPGSALQKLRLIGWRAGALSCGKSPGQNSVNQRLISMYLGKIYHNWRRKNLV
jgi:hypothetical protein